MCPATSFPVWNGPPGLNRRICVCADGVKTPGFPLIAVNGGARMNRSCYAR